MMSCCLLKHEKLNAQYVQLYSAIVQGKIQIKTIALFRSNFLITAWVRVGAQQPQRRAIGAGRGGGGDEI